jgi:hypothetical protein
VIVTLSTPSNVSASASVGRNMSWTPSASVKDLGRQRGVDDGLQRDQLGRGF